MTKQFGLAPRKRSPRKPQDATKAANEDSLTQGGESQSGATSGPVVVPPVDKPTPDAPLAFGRRVEATVRAAVTHDLKCWPPWFQDVLEGRKTFEVRRDDRGYREGDTLLLREWEPTTAAYTGRSLRTKVTYLVRAVPGIPGDMVVMGVEVAGK